MGAFSQTSQTRPGQLDPYVTALADPSGVAVRPPQFTAGTSPFAIRVDQRTDTVYVANFGDNSVSIVDGRNCNATNTAGCGRSFRAVPVGGYPNGLAISEATGTVYVANFFDNNVSVFGPHFTQK